MIGRSTVESIQSGALYGFAAQVDGLCRRFLDELGPSAVVATGGLAETIAPLADDGRPRRAVAHPAWSAHHLRGEYLSLPGRGSRRMTTPKPTEVGGSLTGGPGDELPYRFDRSHQVAAESAGSSATSVPAKSPATVVSVAGRIMLSRPQGKLAFADLRDSSGDGAAVRAERRHRRLRSLHPAVPGRLDRGPGRGGADPARRAVRQGGRRGCCWPEARRSFGDKWRGVTDVETRYRQREVDLWANEESRRILSLRQPLVGACASACGTGASSRWRRPILHPVPERRQGPAAS